MQLLETDWNAPGGAAEVPTDYPDAPIAEFVNWVRRTSAWLENPELVERKVRKLNMALAEYRNGVRPDEETATQKQSRLAAVQAAIAAQIEADELAELDRLTRPDNAPVS